jgi:hypothetical protein
MRNTNEQPPISNGGNHAAMARRALPPIVVAADGNEPNAAKYVRVVRDSCFLMSLGVDFVVKCSMMKINSGKKSAKNDANDELAGTHCSVVGGVRRRQNESCYNNSDEKSAEATDNDGRSNGARKFRNGDC